MLSIRKINPMVRAIGTMGAVAAIAGGITFAAFTSNTAALSQVSMETPAPGLAIADVTGPSTCPATSSDSWSGNNTTPGSITGHDFSDLTSTPQTFQFCLMNNSSTSGSEAITMTPKGTLSATGLSLTDVTLKVGCGTTTAVGGSLDQFNSTDNFMVEGSLAQNSVDLCTATASLTNPSYSGPGGSIAAFELDFVGTVSS